MFDVDALREKVFLRRIGGRVVSHSEAEQAYREGKIGNLVEQFPDVFGSDD